MTRPPPITAHRARQPQQRHAARVLSCADTGAGHEAVAVPHPRNLELLISITLSIQTLTLTPSLVLKGTPRKGLSLASCSKASASPWRLATNLSQLYIYINSSYDEALHSLSECDFEIPKRHQAPAHIWGLPR